MVSQEFLGDIMSQLGVDVGGNFIIHIWACSGDLEEQVM